MSISATVEAGRAAGPRLLPALAAAAKRAWAACVVWRMEQHALAMLQAMSDRELSDIGLSRADIDDAARGRKAPLIREC